MNEAAWPPGDCRPCGRCCFDERATYIPLFGVDLDRMSERTLALTERVGERLHMKFVGGHCAALVIDTERLTFLCGVYEERPDVCRALVRGSGHCREAWTDKSGRPDVAVARLRAS